MSLECNSLAKLTLLKERASMLKKTRAFFDNRGFIEVDCPLLSHMAPIDTYIDLFEVSLGGNEKGFLHSSPEYGMKRLLALGLDNIYQLSHVCRMEEEGALHNPEFTLIEWYRKNTTFDSFISETCLLMEEFLGKVPFEILTYREAVQTYFGLCYQQATVEELITQAKKYNLHIAPDVKDELLNVIWGCLIEPYLGQNGLTMITDYPESQAALAKIVDKNGERVAIRFEFYHKGIELGNGYHELFNADEQKKRLEQSNLKRLELGKNPLPIDYRFLSALEKDFPDCYGIAVGFDRLLMLKENLTSIHDILPFSWKDS